MLPLVLRAIPHFPRVLIAKPPLTESFAPGSTSINSLSQELIDEIVSYFVYDTGTLLACSRTCRSWNVAATPLLHFSLTAYIGSTYLDSEKHQWPKPLKRSYELGLLRFVKRFRIRSLAGLKFSPKRLNGSTIRYFSALTNLQKIHIWDLQVSSFMPNIQQYFGHFAPSLRALILVRPSGSSRQLLYFIGLFQNLQDLTLVIPVLTSDEESAADSALVPLFKPPLCGRLMIIKYDGETLIKDMIKLFGGLRFRDMFLHKVRLTRLLLEECADTLEELEIRLVNFDRKDFSK